MALELPVGVPTLPIVSQRFPFVHGDGTGTGPRLWLSFPPHGHHGNRRFDHFTSDPLNRLYGCSSRWLEAPPWGSLRSSGTSSGCQTPNRPRLAYGGLLEGGDSLDHDLWSCRPRCPQRVHEPLLELRPVEGGRSHPRARIRDRLSCTTCHPAMPARSNASPNTPGCTATAPEGPSGQIRSSRRLRTPSISEKGRLHSQSRSDAATLSLISYRISGRVLENNDADQDLRSISSRRDRPVVLVEISTHDEERFVHAGDVLPATHAVARTRPELFEPVAPIERARPNGALRRRVVTASSAFMPV